MYCGGINIDNIVLQQYVFLNEELVNRGYAEWVTYQQQEEVEGAVGGVV